jgi:hypothetical protein
MALPIVGQDKIYVATTQTCVLRRAILYSQRRLVIRCAATRTAHRVKLREITCYTLSNAILAPARDAVILTLKTHTFIFTLNAFSTLLLRTASVGHSRRTFHFFHFSLRTLHILR